ncbi:MAG TPA: acetyl-CoA C-acyltransferase [Gammaproteobacteria bacterium]|nr:acetyl-CoA C-acyltransferase [Gammaproteobacteria bacterium]|tara:strand:- start:81 stop:1271 length:1191 start_codon:yes stop_codon:yes gene_type:complete
MTKAYIIDAKRTPVGKARGSLSKTRADDLLIHSIQSVLSTLSHADEIKNNIDDVIVGCAMPEGPQGLNVARIAALLAGLPDSTPAYTLNRFCASGLQAVANAAEMVKSGSADLVIAAGVESMSTVPMMGFKPSINPKVIAEDENIAIAFGMGLTAEKVANKYKISREEQDAFALESHERALKANKEGLFSDEIVPITTTESVYSLETKEYSVKTNVVSQDEGPREGSSIESLAKLRTVFAQEGSVTAATSSQMSDGAAAVLIASEAAVKKYNLTPKAEFVAYAVAGVPAEIMGIGPVKAIPKALKRAGLTLDDIGWIELNEAFAAQSLAVINELNLDRAKVNPQGGAIALGHPLGATGAIRTATLVSALQRNNFEYGMISMCIGTGMGAAGILKKV